MISKEDKRAHPVFYWAFLVLLALCAFQLFSIAIGEVEGAWTANTYNSTTDMSHTGGNDNFVHTKDNLYAVPYVSSADELWIAHKPTTGGSWEYGLITATYSDYVTVGVLCSSNNTLIVYAMEARPTGAGVLWIKWPGSDWDDWTGYTVETGAIAIQGFAINNTDVICFGYRASTGVYLELFNLTILSTSGTKLFTNVGSSIEISVAANQSGDFWAFYGGQPADHFFRDYNQSVAAVQITGSWKECRLVCLSNDRFGVTAQWSSAYRRLYWMYQTTHGGSFQSVIISPQSISDYWSYSPKAILTQDSLTVYLLGYDSSDSKVYEYHASWAAIESTWQASEVELASGSHYPLGASNSVWPKTAGISWCQPATGQAIHIMKISTGPPYPMQIWTQSVTWTPDLTTAWPEITTTGLDEGTYDVLYSFSMSKSGGTSPFEWTIVSGPIWLEIGLATGILSGTPTGIGTFEVEIQLADVIPRSDTEIFNLKISSAVTEGGLEPTEGFSAEDLELASLWIILATAAIGVGLAREFKRFTHKKQ